MEKTKYRVVTETSTGLRGKSRAYTATEAIEHVKASLDVGCLVVRVEIVK